MSMDTLLELSRLAMLPMVGLLWRISTQLATLTATLEAHKGRLDRLERAEGKA